MQSSFIKNKVKKLQGGREQKLPKRQSVTTTRLLEGSKPQTPQHQMLVIVWSSSNSRSLVVGMQTGTGTLENRLAVSF